MLASSTATDKLTSWEWVVILVGFQSPIFVTMLGIMGVVNLRESREGQQGMALAVSVTLLFPLLLVDGMLIYLASVTLHSFGAPRGWCRSASCW